MGWTLTGVAFHFDGAPTTAHADGNNVAWTCPFCHHPLLFVYGRGRIGSAAQRPNECPGCDQQFHLDPPYGFAPEPPAGESHQPAAEMAFLRA